MNQRPRSPAVAQAWLRLPKTIEDAIDGLTEKDLDLRGGPERWSIRETVHHLVESNLIASNIIIAALATNGGTYDWSWVMPNGAWMKRLGYGAAAIEPSLVMLEALCAHVSRVLLAAPGSMRRHVMLLDAPGAALRRRTVAQVLADECEHARHHLDDLLATRRAYDRVRSKSASSRAPRRTGRSRRAAR